MRVRIDSTLVCGDPLRPQDLPEADAVRFMPARNGGWRDGAGFERSDYEDAGCPRCTVDFRVTRSFARMRDVARFLTALHSVNPPHAWRGPVVLEWDNESGAAIALNAGYGVLTLAGPAQSANGTASLMVQLSYSLILGVSGGQPSDPPQTDFPPGPDPYVPHY
jgi:hypothetical protein